MKRSRLALPPRFTRGHFRAHAARMRVAINGVDFGAMLPTEFKTGSVGWQLQTKGDVTVGDTTVYAQFDLKVTVINSKTLPRDGT